MALRETSVRPLQPWLIRWEIFAVFAVSLGASALNAILSLISSLLSKQSLASQQATLVTPEAANNWLDLALQLATIAESLAPVVLVIYLLVRSDDYAKIGLDASQPGRDAAKGAALAAIIGGIGLAYYVVAYKLGSNLNIVPEDLPAVWWRIPVLVLYAIQNGMLEETLMIGYLLTRLDQLEVKPWRAIVISALLRGCYHLYQGFGPFFGNAVMGLAFGILFRRWRRVTPFIIAHTLIDAGAFLGYAALHGKVSWLP
ncbi:MAG TPA: type II CAAX endopeptidase family protein [Streptosporangiaceae bacterium]|nr:type II CAAX endopeptidase family protein [Streptosporangiaceae bacterium]